LKEHMPNSSQTFPNYTRNENGDAVIEWASDASMRDYFAARALSGLLVGDPITWNKTGRIRKSEMDAIAQAAYSIADAMLAERERK